VSEDALCEGPSNCSMTQFPAKLSSMCNTQQSATWS